MSSKRVLVTGSSRGIGRAIALRLAQDGWIVALHYGFDQESVDRVRDELGSANSGCYQADLASEAGADHLWNMATAEGPLDALVNNAGIYRPISFLAEDEQWDRIWEETMRVNLLSPMRLMRLAAKDFASKGAGKIVNVASRVGFRGESGAASYAASKAALINLTRSAAVELAATGVQVFGIAPGWVETAMAREGMETRLEAILKDIPAGRMASPKDCGAVCAFLLREEASYLTGMTIDVNGASYFH